MITKAQAMDSQAFHLGECSVDRDKSGKARPYTITRRYRRSGQTHIWKTRPNEFRVPIRRGLYDNGHLTQVNAERFHTEEDCPAEAEARN